MQDAATTESASRELAQLVQNAQRGDRTAFALLYRDFARVVHGILLARCGADDADDLTQDLFMRVFEQLPELREPSAFPGWLCTAARNAGADHLRTRRRKPAAAGLTAVTEDAVDQRATPSETAMQRETASTVLACIQQLPDAYRETLVLRLVEGLSGPEIAAHTGLTHGSVRVNLTRGITMLRPILNEAGLP